MNLFQYRISFRDKLFTKKNRNPLVNWYAQIVWEDRLKTVTESKIATFVNNCQTNKSMMPTKSLIKTQNKHFPLIDWIVLVYKVLALWLRQIHPLENAIQVFVRLAVPPVTSQMSVIGIFLLLLRSEHVDYRKYHETECSMLNPAIRVDPNIPNFEFCLSICANTEEATYATWNHLDHDCRQIIFHFF